MRCSGRGGVCFWFFFLNLPQTPFAVCCCRAVCGVLLLFVAVAAVLSDRGATFSCCRDLCMIAVR